MAPLPGLIFTALLVLGGVLLLGREVLVLGGAKRRGAEMIPHYKRFRRRATGLVVLFLLFLSALAFEPLARAAAFDARLTLLYFLGAMILLIWLLLIAARDMRETAIDALAERQTMAASMLRDATERARRAGGEKGDDRDPPGPPS